MEFSIDIHNSLQGDITIEDFSKEYEYYLPEGDSYPDSKIDEIDGVSTLRYKYSKTVTLNTILKAGNDEVTLIDVLYHKHEDDVDVCNFHVDEDGYYMVNHFILPTKEWYESFIKNPDEDVQTYISSGIYFMDEEQLKKVVDGEIVDAEIKELLERNYEGTDVLQCKIDVFFTGNLQQCYINYCKKIYENLLNKCKTQDVDTYARDFIWMTLNIIDYLVGFKQFLEAERIIEEFKTCGGFCQNDKIHKNYSGCGCSKT